jgi:N-acetylneuraminic acid mutarotase
MLGGFPSNGCDFDSFEVYDPTIRKWNSLPPMTYGRASFGAFVGAKNEIYVIGGVNPNNTKASETIEKFDPKLNKWVTLIDISSSPRWDYASVQDKNGLVYVLGGIFWKTSTTGEEFYTAGSQVDTFNTQFEKWCPSNAAP